MDENCKKLIKHCEKKDILDILKSLKQTERTNIFNKSVKIIEKIADEVCEIKIPCEKKLNKQEDLKNMLNCNDIKYCYGVYIIECVCGQSKEQKCICNKNHKEKDDKSSKKRIVLYIGKGGTINRCAYSEQDVIKRLGNVKESNMQAITWFNCLLSICETICNCHGSEGEDTNSQCHLVVKIICLDKFNVEGKKPKCLAPGFVESLLLQVYFLENQHLPIINNEL